MTAGVLNRETRGSVDIIGISTRTTVHGVGTVAAIQCIVSITTNKAVSPYAADDIIIAIAAADGVGGEVRRTARIIKIACAGILQNLKAVEEIDIRIAYIQIDRRVVRFPDRIRTPGIRDFEAIKLARIEHTDIVNIVAVAADHLLEIIELIGFNNIARRIQDVNDPVVTGLAIRIRPDGQGYAIICPILAAADLCIEIAIIDLIGAQSTIKRIALCIVTGKSAATRKQIIARAAEKRIRSRACCNRIRLAVRAIHRYRMGDRAEIDRVEARAKNDRIKIREQLIITAAR